jgi:hypothetical protein
LFFWIDILVLRSNKFWMKNITKNLILLVVISGIIVVLTACPQKDTNPPVITVHGANPAHHCQGIDYNDAVIGGATAYDEIDGDLTGQIQVTNNVSIADTGTYFVNYSVQDTDGNRAEAQRAVVVIYCKKK